MKWVEEFRQTRALRTLAQDIARATTRAWRLMEVCGGQTHAIVRHGLDTLLPRSLELVHGPGCPVCVTPADIIDKAVLVAQRPDALLCSFGDMLRVPGSTQSLARAKAGGAHVRMVYSPLDAVGLAQASPHTQVVFLAVGFETTAPAHALAVLQAQALGLKNFSLLVAHVLVPPAIEAIAASADSRIDGFLAAGHVCAVMGEAPYRPLAGRLRVPIVITGFEPVDILRGVLCCVRQLEAGRAEAENAYDRAVSEAGNLQAQDLVRQVFRVATQRWRGMGELAHSGLALRDEYAAFDAERRFGLSDVHAADDARCHGGEVLRGVIKPAQCPAFGTACTPDHPLGAPMVSSEGACAAYHRYRAPAPMAPASPSPAP